MSRSLALLGMLLLASLAGGCDEPPVGVPTTPPPPGGIRGTVILGPTCPIGDPEATDPIACLTPYSAQLVILDDQNQVAGRVTSGPDGRFEIELPAGDYVITPISGDPYPLAQPLPVVVAAGQFSEVQVNYDTGIR